MNYINKIKPFVIPHDCAGSYYNERNFCPNCEQKVDTSNQLGFAHGPLGIMSVIECPSCLTRWNFHTFDHWEKKNIYSDVQTFLQAVEEGKNKHFNEEIV